MTNPPGTTTDAIREVRTATQLRDAMVQSLVKFGAAEDPRVVAAFRAVPRHLAMPEVDVTKAYDAEFAAVTKTDPTGVDISSVSAPRVQAMQIEQAQIEPGMNVLEVGSGGPNAAYLAEMVGKEGRVVTMDIDSDVTDRARTFLTATGYENVTVLTADAENGARHHAPFDRIVVTVQAADIPPAWITQLKDGGRLVVPLRMRGLTRTVAFVRDGERLVSDGFDLCGFVPMQGIGENRVQLAVLHDVEGEEVALRLDGHPEPDTRALAEALVMPRATAWSGVTLGGMESNEHLDLWLTTALDNLPLMAAKPGARKRGLVASASPLGVPTLVDGGTFAYRTVRATDAEDRFELGAIGHGPHGQQLAKRLVAEIQIWDREHRGDRARIEVDPAGTPDDRLPAGRHIERRHTRVTITWP
ncbi:methyltransferase, FxLD system [Actinacidiphila rubida]|uniref:Protein-L-isoaspartate O-methyltransferase n=1 Tax=Actinacidiphila rubida TaxID=310780 RepID=A0A1H8UHP8_9ACTN|nr:methyltransferase, FxLD system [Actinacidiphila rubida]SEP02557.1 protein-L-isoaspartate(D-aspartate) O-methyltransferase [Actinacidiphila rubida]